MSDETAPQQADETPADDDTRGTPQFYEYWNSMDFVSWMGARIVESADGHAKVYFEPGQHHRGAGVGGRAVTGAVQSYIFDIVIGAAVASLARGTKPQVTVTLEMAFEHPAYDAPLTFEAHLTALQAPMKAAAANLEFEKAASIRDRIKQLRTRELGLTGSRH